MQIEATVQLVARLIQEYELEISSVQNRSDVRPITDQFGGMFEVIQSKAGKLVDK